MAEYSLPLARDSQFRTNNIMPIMADRPTPRPADIFFLDRT
jgi:hypothetical protein